MAQKFETFCKDKKHPKNCVKKIKQINDKWRLKYGAMVSFLTEHFVTEGRNMFKGVIFDLEVVVIRCHF